jgi:6-phosphofructokinase 1
MDTAHKISLLARERGLELVGIGGPKTIDNDVGDSEFKLIDHTPGYGSAAKYWMHAVQCANEENQGSCPADPVLVMQAMGRKIGYIPAAARLADPAREMPLQIYMAENHCSLDQLADQVNDQLKTDGRCMVVISEGFDVGDIGAVQDAFKHTSFSASQLTAAQIVVNHLNRVGLAAKGNARGNVPGTDQRHSMAYASTVDLDEAYHAGEMAAILAGTGQNGYMSTILRNAGPVYSVCYDKVPLEDVANSERTFPREWIAANGIDVTDDFIAYAKPLVGEGMVGLPMIDGRQRMTRFQPVYADQKLPTYVLQADRT